MKTPSLLALSALVLAACGGNASSGRCDGRMGSTLLTGPINASTSNWHSVSGGQVLLLLRYANDNLRIESRFRPPSLQDGRGTFPLPTSSGSGGSVVAWDVKAPEQRPPLASGSLTFQGWGEKLSGEFSMLQQDGTSLRCTFDLAHDAASDAP